ncbi:hypothetical protein GCM10022254_22270 [Actinomadura meridiana]|uniref:Uncharacterized protein n=1 Tax=Actinomadura meridiana TaxID=559626 RepID=A0ABP8BXE1_9ACTN
MRELCRPARPVARLLLVALGLLGFVVGPGGVGTPGGTSLTGAITSGTTQQAPARTRDPAQDRKRPARTRSTHATRAQAAHAQAAQAQVLVAVAKAQPAHPSNAAHAPSAVLAASGAGLRPPSARVVRAAAVLPAPDVPPTGVPRGRAPPSSPRI